MFFVYVCHVDVSVCVIWQNDLMKGTKFQHNVRFLTQQEFYEAENWVPAVVTAWQLTEFVYLLSCVTTRFVLLQKLIFQGFVLSSTVGKNLKR